MDALVIDAHAHFAPATVAHPHAGGGDAGVPVTTARLQEAHRAAPPTVTEDELLARLDESHVDKLVTVTPSVMRFDNSYSVAVAQRHPNRIRVVAHIDFSSPHRVDRLRSEMRDPSVVGVRVIVLGDDAPLLDVDAGRSFWDAAAADGVPVAVFAPQCAPALGRIARSFPALQLLLDHACLDVLPTGDPGRDRFAGWSDVLDLAALPNVTIKVSGIIDAAREPYPFPTAQARLGELHDRFGPDRLVWGSNYTPVRLVATYAESVDWLREGCDFLTAEDRAKVLGGNAARVYELPWTTAAR
jgi:predicted TIM-barrel fold metal-dependent hydrolase